MSFKSRVFLNPSKGGVFFTLSSLFFVVNVASAQSLCTSHLLEVVDGDSLPSLSQTSTFLDDLSSDIILSAKTRLRIQNKMENNPLWSEIVKYEVGISSKRLQSAIYGLTYDIEDSADVSIPDLGLVYDSKTTLTTHEKEKLISDLSGHLKKHMIQTLYKQIEFLSYFDVQQSDVKWLKFFFVQTMAYPFISIYSEENYQSYTNMILALDKLILNLQSQSQTTGKDNFLLSSFFSDNELTHALRNFADVENKKGRSFLSTSDLNPRSWNTY